MAQNIAQQLEDAVNSGVLFKHPAVVAAIDHIRVLEEKLAKKTKRDEKKTNKVIKEIVDQVETRTPTAPSKVETVVDAKAKKGFFNRGK